MCSPSPPIRTLTDARHSDLSSRTFLKMRLHYPVRVGIKIIYVLNCCKIIFGTLPNRKDDILPSTSS